MAVKAMFAVNGFEPESDGTYRVNMHIWSGAHHTPSVTNDAYFTPTTLAATVNASLQGFVEGYIQSEWEVSFNQLMDSVKMLNPISLL